MFPNNELNNDLKFTQEINEEIHAARTKRVQCLYRVSTEQQITYNDKKQADIPMQRMACRKFVAEHGWKIVFEDQEDGISGHKIRAENRDKIQLIKQRAKKKQFDILLVFMFDRIGRIADETPFVVEWFVSYAQMYECAEFETKKMIISTLIERIEVSRDYQVKVTFNVTLEQFLEMLAPQQS